jgi:hypothetical protein
MSEVLQWTAAIVVLVAFALSRWEAWSVLSYRYLVFNCIGGAGLSAAALLSSQWGFVLSGGRVGPCGPGESSASASVDVKCASRRHRPSARVDTRVVREQRAFEGHTHGYCFPWCDARSHEMSELPDGGSTDVS